MIKYPYLASISGFRYEVNRSELALKTQAFFEVHLDALLTQNGFSTNKPVQLLDLGFIIKIFKGIFEFALRPVSCILLAFVCSKNESIIGLPDEPFPNFRALNSVDRRNLCSSGTLYDGF